MLTYFLPIPPNAAVPISGTYPLTRLAVEDQTLAGSQTLYGYSTLKPTSLQESAYPAVALSLVVENPSSEAVDASFMFSLPMGGWTDCSYSDGKGTLFSAASTYQACGARCTAANNCSSWEFEDAASSCTHNAGIPYTTHKVGSHCGVRSDEGGWTQSKDGASITWSQKPAGGLMSPTAGDVTVRGVVADGTDVGSTRVTLLAEDDPAVLWSSFIKNGTQASDGAGAAFPKVAAHGAVSVTSSVPAGGNATLSIIFAWHFPNRDFTHTVLGNMYTELWPSSGAVAAELGTEAKLKDVITDINTHHQVIAHRDNPTPVWLKDMLINQWSHFHMLMWYKDGRMREYEAWSCDDVDSVHNDYQRHLLYLWAYPEFEYNKMDAWSSFAQDADGHVWESLG